MKIDSQNPSLALNPVSDVIAKYHLARLYLLNYFIICDYCGKSYLNESIFSDNKTDLSCPFCKWKYESERSSN